LACVRDFVLRAVRHRADLLFFCVRKRNRSNEEREGYERLALLEWGEQASGGQIDTREMEKVA